jgi:hypothetical protein
MPDESRERQSWWRSRFGLALVGFLVIAGFYIVTEHRAHLFGVLPYLLILACPLMHFLHRGHGGGHAGHGGGDSGRRGHDR